MTSSPPSSPPTILVVDDDAVNLRMVGEALDGLGYAVDSVSDGVQALERIQSNPPDLVLLDVMMPRLNGLEVCRIVKSKTEAFIPIILLTVKSDIDSKVTGLRIGADDYVSKPFNPLELRARVASMLRIKALQDKLINKRRELEALSITDELTGLLNHRAMQQRLRDEFIRAERYNAPLSIVMADVDYFKQVNDKFGHLVGDKVLVQMGKVMSQCLREIDVVARYGGEEFLVILPETHFTGSLAVAERMWRAIGATDFEINNQVLNVTISMGIAFYPNKAVTTIEDLVGLADQALYQAKREGRNRICLHQHLSYMYRPERGAAP